MMVLNRIGTLPYVARLRRREVDKPKARVRGTLNESPAAESPPSPQPSPASGARRIRTSSLTHHALDRLEALRGQLSSSSASRRSMMTRPLIVIR